MKSNVKRGGGFAGLLRYALDRGLKCEIVGGNMEGRNPGQVAREFGASRRQRREVKRPVLHATLSLPPGEHLSPEAWNELAHAFMRKIGLDPENHQFVVVRHDDTHCEHVHIITSRIGLNGSLWHGVNEALVATAATQKLEREFGLTITKGPNLETEKPGAGVRAGLKMEQAERELWAQRGVEPPKARIAKAVELAIRRSDGTPDSLRTLLGKSGIEARISVGGGRVTGISYGLRTSWDGGEEETNYKGVHVGARCDAKAIERRLAERREQIARDAAVLLRAQDVRFENELRAANPERMARLAARAAEIRRQDDAEFPAPTRDRVAQDPQPAAGDGPARRQGAGGSAGLAGLRDALGSPAGRPGDGKPGPQASDAPAGPGPVGRDDAANDPGNTSGRAGAAGPDRASTEAQSDGRGFGTLGIDRQPEFPAGGEAEEHRAHADGRPATPPHADPEVGWASIEVGVTVGVAFRMPNRRVHDWYNLARLYRANLAPEVSRRVRFVRTDPDAGAVRVLLDDGTQIVDTGDRITGHWQGTEPPDGAVSAMIDMARVRGWATVNLTGDAAFQREAWLECQRQGIVAANYAPPADLVAVWEAEQAASRSQPAASQEVPPPDPEPETSDPWAGLEAEGAASSAWFAWVRIARIYRRDLQPEVATHVRYVRSNKPAGPITVGLTDGAVIQDAGRRISTAWREQAGVSMPAITVMTEMARAKGWSALRIRGGNEEFRRQAWLACQRAGLDVHDYVPPPDLVAAWHMEKARAEAQTEEGMNGQNPGDGGSRRSMGPRPSDPDRARPGTGGTRSTEGGDQPERGRDGDAGAGARREAPTDDRPGSAGRPGRRGQDRYRDFAPLRAPDVSATRFGNPAPRPELGDSQGPARPDGAPKPADSRPSGENRSARSRGDRQQDDEPWDAKFKRASAERRRARNTAEGQSLRPAASRHGREKPTDPEQGIGGRQGRASEGAAKVGERTPWAGRGPTLPFQNDAARQEGRRYLAEVHRIPRTVWDRAEKAKFIHYCPDQGIAFLGRIADQPMAVSVWLHPIPEAPYRALPNSDESVPPVLMGDPRYVVFVTDGVTALRALAEAERNQKAVPTVVALYAPSPGSVLLRLPPDLRDLIANAESVTGYGVVNMREVNEHVDRWRLLYGPGHHEPGLNDPEPEYDPTDTFPSANPKPGGKK